MTPQSCPSAPSDEAGGEGEADTDVEEEAGGEADVSGEEGEAGTDALEEEEEGEEEEAGAAETTLANVVGAGAFTSATLATVSTFGSALTASFSDVAPPAAGSDGVAGGVDGLDVGGRGVELDDGAGEAAPPAPADGEVEPDPEEPPAHISASDAA